MPKKRIDRSIDLAAGTVTFTELSTEETIMADCAALCGGKKVYDALPEMAKRTILHGANGKFGDSAADPNTAAIKQITSTIEQVMAGTWNAKGTGGGPRVSDLHQAVFEVACAKAKAKGKDDPTLDQIVDLLDKKTPEQRKDIGNTAEVKAAKLRIVNTRNAEKLKKAETDAKGSDTDLDAMLA